MGYEIRRTGPAVTAKAGLFSNYDSSLVYRGVNTETLSLAHDSPAFSQLIELGSELSNHQFRDVKPAEYSPLIEQFENEEKQLVAQGKNVKAIADADTLFDRVHRCFIALRSARNMNRNVRIEYVNIGIY